MDEVSRGAYHRALVSIGVYFFSKENWDTKLKLLHQLFNAFVDFFVFIFTTGFIITCTDVVAWIEGICIWISGVIAYAMIAICLIFRRQFRHFLEELAFKDTIMDMPFIDHIFKTNYEQTRIQELKYFVANTQRKVFKYTTIILKFYCVSVLTTTSLYVIDAIYQMVVREDKSLRILAFNMWFPWKLDDFNVYIATFIFHAYGGFITAMNYPSVQSTIVLLMSQIIRHLRILTYILHNLDDLVLEVSRKRDDRWQLMCTSILAQCVKHYVWIKNLSNRLNLITKTFYLALILNAMMLVCVCSVKISISHKLSYDLIKYCLHEFLFTLMVLLFCSLGQQVQNECEKLEQAVLEKWYIFNKTHRVDVKIFHLAVSQKMPIYIFGSITLSLPTFSWFLKTGMSFFTLAMSVLED